MPEPTRLLGGLVFGEGPRWHDGRLWFSDMHAHRVIAVDEAGKAETICEMEDRPSGLGWLPDGSLLIVSMGQRKLVRLEKTHLVDHADLSSVATGDCNDMVVDREGRAYVGNFGFDFMSGGQFTPASLAIVEPDGSVREGAAGLGFPNGAVITPDGKTLIVAESFGRKLTAFTIGKGGALSGQRTWAELGQATPDGICLDAEGAVWLAAPGSAEFLRVREGGDVAERIAMPGRMPIACMLGGGGRRTLFLLVADGSQDDLRLGHTSATIETVPVAVGGAGWP